MGSDPHCSSTSEAPTPNELAIFNPGGDAATVVTAVEGEGLGSWITRWFATGGETTNDNVTLQVPAGAATQGNHTAVITWTLTTGPGQ